MHDRSESRALRLLGHLPVAHAPELFVRDALNQIGHCSQPEVTTMAKHSRENGADLFAIARLLTAFSFLFAMQLTV